MQRTAMSFSSSLLRFRRRPDRLLLSLPLLDSESLRDRVELLEEEEAEKSLSLSLEDGE